MTTTQPDTTLLWKPQDVVPAAEALRTGRVQITETTQASVPTLTADNATGKSVFFVAGEVVFGGQQDRIVTDSFIVPPGEAIIPVACVEAGRWSGSAAFEARTGLGPRRLRHGAVIGGRTGGTVDQSNVWSVVDEVLTAAQTAHPTGSLRASVERDDDQLDAMVALAPLPGQCGVAIGLRDKVIGVELFTSEAVLVSYWEPIMRSYALDNSDAYRGRPSLGRVLRFIRTAVDGLQPVPLPKAGHGHQFRVATKSFVANALVSENTLVHLVVLAA